MPLTGADIYKQLHDPGDTSSMDRVGRGCGDLKTIHNDVADKLTDSQNTLNTFWKGQAADSGSAGLTPLITTSRTAANKMDTMRESIEQQSAAFTTAKNSVVPVDDSRPDDNTIEDWLSIGASDDEKKAAKFDTDTNANVATYNQYSGGSQARSENIPVDYPAAHDPSVSSGGITPDRIDTGKPGGSHVSGSGGHSGGYSGGYTGGPSTYTAPPGAAGYHAPPPPGHSTAGVNTPAANDSTSAAFAGPTQTPGGPGSPSWQGPGGTGINGPGGGNSGGFGPGFGPVGGFGGGIGGGGGFGPGGSRGGFGPGGGGSGFGPGGGGASSGGAAGMGRGVGAGAGTGAGAMGEGAGAARPGGMGAAGAKGQPGMGGMGAGGAKGGKGPEDEEHQRKILLSEEDPDSIFGGYDGDKPTPPVIGA
ncbi:hypothetical protein AB0878_15040 [Amycolatopsis sp. NPDC047767]|uniref:hypothetical protein n=1 Tax=Amycolatopsis sp. NPDC047767 TaxID=3156765 RepID=UPI003455B2CA